MRVAILIIFLLSCNVSGQNTNEELRRELEFQKLLLESKRVAAEAHQEAVKADQQTAEIVTKAVNTISSLKAEVKQLKHTLYETKKALDSVESTDNVQPFKLSPISGG
jgi:uncharacterized protein YlxW (UPF0749 family)